MSRTVSGYEIIDKLGSGLQGKVYRAKTIATGEIVAIKLIDQDVLRGNPKVFNNLRREIDAMTRVSSHPNIVAIKGVEYDVTKPRKRRPGAVRRCVLIAMEIAQGGELFDYLMVGRFPENLARAYFRQMMEALQHAHDNHVAHRDLKPENLLVDGSYNLRVADWGLSAVVDDLDSALLRTQCGTRAYMCPEVLRRLPYRGEKADVWSAGVILFIMLAGFPPFEHAAPGDWWYDRVAANQHSLFWQAHERSVDFPPAAKELLNTIFISDPSARATVEAVLAHPWMATTDDPAPIKAEMRDRRVRILTDKGVPLPADLVAASSGSTSGDESMGGVTTGGAGATVAASASDSEDVAMTSSSPIGGAAASAAGGAGGLIASAATSVMSTSSSAMGVGGGASSSVPSAASSSASNDLFASTVTRSAAAPVPPMPARRPGFPSRSAAIKAPIAAPSSSSSPAPSASPLPSPSAPIAAAIPDSAVAEALPANLIGARATQVCIRDSSPAAASAATAARAVAGLLESLHATVAVRIHAGGSCADAAAAATDAASASAGVASGPSIKLRATVPPSLGASTLPTRIDCKIYAVPDALRGSRPELPADAAFVVDVTRTSGDALAFAALFARMQRALLSVSAASASTTGTGSATAAEAAVAAKVAASTAAASAGGGEDEEDGEGGLDSQKLEVL